MLDQILGKSEIESRLKGKSVNLQITCRNAIVPLLECCRPLHSFFCDDSSPKSQSSIQVYNNFHHHLQDGLQPKEALHKCSTDIFIKLERTRDNLEEYLDAVMAECRNNKCREFTSCLTERALDRVVEILQHRNKLSYKDFK